MDKSQWAEIDRVFRACRELPVGERARFLDKECPDENVRKEVASLLAHHSEQFLETPIVKSTRTETFRRGLEPLDGNFATERVLHESVTSTVYLAHEVRSGRPIVLKQARRHGETLGILDRQPPGQVKRLRIGTFENCPTLIMNHSPGVPITRFADDHDLDEAARMELFAKTCAVVQQTHSAGQVHGRIDPTHVLAHGTRESMRVELLDSGVITSRRDSIRAVYLELRGVFGNAGTMAPEQTRVEEPVPSTDVYGLGCLLQELLTGTPAFALVASKDGGSAAESARVICEEEAAAANDLVRRALAKDGRERFGTAGEFGAAVSGRN